MFCVIDFFVFVIFYVVFLVLCLYCMWCIMKDYKVESFCMSLSLYSYLLVFLVVYGIVELLFSLIMGVFVLDLDGDGFFFYEVVIFFVLNVFFIFLVCFVKDIDVCCGFFGSCLVWGLKFWFGGLWWLWFVWKLKFMFMNFVGMLGLLLYMFLWGMWFC